MNAPRPTWLVTGGSGFLGRHLLDRLAREPVDVVALGRRPVGGEARFVAADLLDGPGLRRVLAETAPAVVLHLAGRTPPADAEALDRANRVATLRLLDALDGLEHRPRLVVAGSAAELGPVPVEDLPVGEGYPAAPETDYGRSKLAATRAVLGAGGIVARVFNPIGPGLPATQALGRFAALLAAGQGPATLTVGDLSPRRDFVDARDVAEALVALARGASVLFPSPLVGEGRVGGQQPGPARGTPHPTLPHKGGGSPEGKPQGLYHIGTGQSRSVAEGLDLLIRLSGRPVRIEVDVTHPPGPADSRADIRRIRAAVGWSPRIPFERSVADLWAAAVAVDRAG